MSGSFPPLYIRPIALCVFSNDGRILVAEYYDPIKQQHHYRPLGGGIEYGEQAEHTVHREIHEELNAEIKDVRLLGVLENIFTYDGAVGHEIVYVFDGVLVNQNLYKQDSLHGTDDGLADGFTAVWKSLDDFMPGAPPLYPDGLKALLPVAWPIIGGMMQPWKTSSRRVTLHQPPWITVENHEVELPDGRVIGNWAWVITPDFVNVAVVTDEGKFACFRQVKYAVNGSTLAPVGGIATRAKTTPRPLGVRCTKNWATPRTSGRIWVATQSMAIVAAARAICGWQPARTK